MPKQKKNKIDTVITEQVSESNGTKRKGFSPGIIIAAVSGIVVLIVAFSVYYQAQAAPFQQRVLTVDNSVVRMDYFLKRVQMVNSDPVTVLEQLVKEQVVKISAPAFGITVTQAEIDSALIYAADTENIIPGANFTGISVTENEFKTWYARQLETSRLSDAEYKDMTRTNLLAAKIQEKLAGRIPTIAEQVHINVVVLGNLEDAEKAKARIQAGENFTAVASDMSLDPQTKDNGGDFGWIPRGVLPYDDTMFALKNGELSDPVAVDPSSHASQYLLFMVSEKSAGRDIDADLMQVLQSQALNDWLAQEVPTHSITVNYDFENAANQAWITWQLTKVDR